MSLTIGAGPSTTTTTSSSASILVLADDKDILGEGPLHDPRTQKLYRVDIEGKKVLAVDVSNLNSSSAPSSSPPPPSAAVAETPEAVGCAALTSDPSKLLVALSRSVHLVDVSTSSFDSDPLAMLDESEGVEGMRFNDGKVSPQGTFVIGRMHSKWRDGKKGAVYALAKKQGESSSSSSWALEKVLDSEEVGMGNGIAWLKVKDQWFFFIVDSAAKTVQRFSADPQTGVPLTGTGKVVLDASDFNNQTPDGMDISDDDGGGECLLFVALAETGTVVAFDPFAREKGLPISRKGTLRLPLTRVTSCAFGSGAGNGGSGNANDLASVLFVTSREESKLAATGEASPVAGAVLFVPDVAAAARIGRDEGKKVIRGGCGAGFVKL